MPTGRLRSQSTSSPNSSRSTPSSPLLSRGFASLRRSHRHTASAIEHRQSTPPSNTSRRQGSDTPSTSGATSPAAPSSNPASPPIQEHKIRLVPNIGITTRCFVFDVIERTLHSGVVLKFGRYSDRNTCSERLSFKSKVVSRCHAEIWQENGKIYIKDTGSSSGTFVNRARLSPANATSRSYAIQDGDLIQLGVDYKGGIQPMYRAVRMRFEVDRSSTLQQTAFSRVAFRQLKHCLRSNLGSASNTTNKNKSSTSTADNLQHSTEQLDNKEPTSSDQPNPILSSSAAASSTTSLSSMDIQECCICLYSMGPGQALFIAPCSHLYHYRCLHPLLVQNFPGFSCPLCRTYSDLNANVAIEKEQVKQLLQLDRKDTLINKKQQKSKARTDDQSVPISSSISSSSSSSSPPPSTARKTNASNTGGFDDMMVTSDTEMGSSSAAAAAATTNNNHASSSGSSEDDDDDEEHHHPTTITGRRKSTDGGLLATTLVGSPSPFELMMHHHHTPNAPTPMETDASPHGPTFL